jgi:hypothetical protein
MLAGPTSLFNIVPGIVMPRCLPFANGMRATKNGRSVSAMDPNICQYQKKIVILLPKHFNSNKTESK